MMPRGDGLLGEQHQQMLFRTMDPRLKRMMRRPPRCSPPRATGPAVQLRMNARSWT